MQILQAPATALFASILAVGIKATTMSAKRNGFRRYLMATTQQRFNGQPRSMSSPAGQQQEQSHGGIHLRDLEQMLLDEEPFGRAGLYSVSYSSYPFVDKAKNQSNVVEKPSSGGGDDTRSTTSAEHAGGGGGTESADGAQSSSDVEDSSEIKQDSQQALAQGTAEGASSNGTEDADDDESGIAAWLLSSSSAHGRALTVVFSLMAVILILAPATVFIASCTVGRVQYPATAAPSVPTTTTTDAVLVVLDSNSSSNGISTLTP